MNKTTCLKENILSLPKIFIIAMMLALFTFMGAGNAFAATISPNTLVNINTPAKYEFPVVEMQEPVNTDEIISETAEEDQAKAIERNQIVCEGIVVYPVYLDASTDELLYDPDFYDVKTYSSLSQFASYTIPKNFYNEALSIAGGDLLFAGWRVDPVFLVDSFKPLRIEYTQKNTSDKEVIQNVFDGDSYPLTYFIPEVNFEMYNSISGALYFIRSNNTSGSCALSVVVNK